MSKPKPLTTKATAAAAVAETPGLLADLRQLIEQSRQAAAAAVNASLTLMYWHIGQRIGTEVLAGQRASYGEGIVVTLSRQLVTDYGRGFDEKNLRRMVQFAELFPGQDIVVTLSRQLSWSHFLALLPVKDPLARDFYAQMCSIERWSVRTLRERVDSMLFERTALSKKPDELIRLELDALQARGDVTAPLLLKDPYVLDFLALDDRYLEKGLEDAILRELEHFLLELGAGFSFVARQRRIQLDSDDFYTAEGIGGPHAGMFMIWPLSITMRGLTSNHAPEIKKCIHFLKTTHGGTGFIHESFYKDDASKFTRKWFAWANTLFGEFLMHVAEKHPALL